MKPLGEKLTSWNRSFIVNNLLCPTCLQKLACPKLTEKIYTTVVLLELRLLLGKKYALNKQYALLSQLRLLTRVYGMTKITHAKCFSMVVR